MTLRTDLDKLSASIAKRAAENSTSLQEMVDALKALTPYYALTAKLDAKGQGDDEGDGATFEAFSAGIENAAEERANVRKAVRSRQQ
jgi:hypothetical protein